MVELQALGLVEGHELHAHDVLTGLHAGGQLTAGCLIGVQVGHEVAQAAARVLRLPVLGEAHEAADVGDGALGIQRIDGKQVEHQARVRHVLVEDREGALAPGARGEVIQCRQQAA